MNKPPRPSYGKPLRRKLAKRIAHIDALDERLRRITQSYVDRFDLYAICRAEGFEVREAYEQLWVALDLLTKAAECSPPAVKTQKRKTNGEPGVDDPSPDEILARSLEMQATWSARDRRNRAEGRRVDA